MARHEIVLCKHGENERYRYQLLRRRTHEVSQLPDSVIGLTYPTPTGYITSVLRMIAHLSR